MSTNEKPNAVASGREKMEKALQEEMQKEKDSGGQN